MHMDILKRRGRPRLSTCKDGYVTIRVSDKDKGIIDYLTQKTGKTKTELVLNGLRMQYNLELFKDN